MVNSLTYFEAHKRASSFLKEKGKDYEGLLFIFLEQLGWNKTKWLLTMKEDIPISHQRLLKQDVLALLEDLPPQYILGYGYFLENKFKVTQDTLIPRSETEELVTLVMTKEKNHSQEILQVVDIGTGSGVIAISLKKTFPNWQVTGVDISKKALEVATENALNHDTLISFKQSDVLKEIKGPLDLIISNPPYIAAKEKDVMDASVLKYEPKNALFAPNEGLFIYEKIAKEAKDKLKPSGKIYLEIGYLQKKVVENIFKEVFPKRQVQTYQDLSGLDRIVVVGAEN